MKLISLQRVTLAFPSVSNTILSRVAQSFCFLNCLLDEVASEGLEPSIVVSIGLVLSTNENAGVRSIVSDLSFVHYLT